MMALVRVHLPYAQSEQCGEMVHLFPPLTSCPGSPLSEYKVLSFIGVGTCSDLFGKENRWGGVGPGAKTVPGGIVLVGL